MFQISAKLLLCEVKNCEVSNSFKVLIFVSIRIMMMTGLVKFRGEAIKTVVYIIRPGSVLPLKKICSHAKEEKY